MENSVTLRTIALLVMLGVRAMAQGTEIGALVGGGAFGLSSGGTSGGGTAGIEACVFCAGRLALFGEYAHWVSAGNANTSDLVRNADLAGGGLRVQWFGRDKLFFDVGLVGGRDQHAEGRGGGLGGIVLSAGIRIPLGKHWYIRPQFRIYGLSPHSLEGLDAHWEASAGAGIGYMF